MFFRCHLFLTLNIGVILYVHFDITVWWISLDRSSYVRLVTVDLGKDRWGIIFVFEITWQTKTQEERLRTSVKPRSCVAYAWDEVTLPPHITCMAPGGTSATYNMNILGDGARLTYENFIYIAFTGTFRKWVQAKYIWWGTLVSYFEYFLLHYAQPINIPGLGYCTLGFIVTACFVWTVLLLYYYVQFCGTSQSVNK